MEFNDLTDSYASTRSRRDTTTPRNLATPSKRSPTTSSTIGVVMLCKSARLRSLVAEAREELNELVKPHRPPLRSLYRVPSNGEAACPS
jgi:hypothetical protein